MKKNRHKLFTFFVFLLVGMLFFCKENKKDGMEVLHWWTSGGEAKAMNELKKIMQEKGHKLKDFPIAGGAGSTAMTVLKSRVISGNPPIAAQMKGPSIQQWGELNALANLNELSENNQWAQKIPQIIQNMMKYKGQFVAVPVNIHRNNWLWMNKRIFDKANLKPPKTWKEFEKLAEKLKKMGIIPVAHGGQSWQDNGVFEIIVLATGGADFYRKSLIELDESSLGSKTMVRVFQRFRRYKGFIDREFSGRDWNLATSMVIQGKAGMQFMGDWAKGEFFAANQKAGDDFIAVPAPDTNSHFIFTTDSFVFFKQKGDLQMKAVIDFAKVILSPSFQINFNLNKGSIPVNLKTNMKQFDIYGKQSMKDFTKNIILPSMAHGVAIRAGVQGAIEDVVTNFFNSDNMSAEDGVKKLVTAIKETK